MSAFLVKDLPPILHQRLKEVAEKHHRSMNREVIAILEKELGGSVPASIPRPNFPSTPLSAEWVRNTVRKARDSR